MKKAATAVGTDLVNRILLGTLADAWNRYPSEVPSPASGTDDQKLLQQVLGLFAQEGVIRMTVKSVALTRSGYAALEQAGRADHRLAELLKGGALPAEETGSSSLVLAILRAHFEWRNKSDG